MKRYLAPIAALFVLAFGIAFAAERIDQYNVQNPDALREILEVMDTEIDALRTLANELRTDHATTRTHDVAVETAVEELIDDHATFKTVVDDLKTLGNAIRAALVGDSLLSDPGLAEGTNHTGPATGQVYFLVNGAMYEKAAVTAGTALSGDGLPQDKYGAWTVDIGANGTIDIGEAAGNATGYDTEAEAIAAIPALAADHVRLGYMTVFADSGGFTTGTSLLNSTGVTDAYYDGDPVFISISAVSSSSPATLTATDPDSPPATLSAPAVTDQVTRGK